MSKAGKRSCAKEIRAKMLGSKSWFRCRYCKFMCARSSATVDHIIPLSRGGNSTKSNLVLCCQECNKEKGRMTADEYRDFRKQRALSSTG